MSISRIFDVSGMTLSIGISLIGITRSGSPSDIFYYNTHSYITEKTRKIRKPNPLLITTFLLNLPIQLDQTNRQIKRLLNPMLNNR